MKYSSCICEWFVYTNYGEYPSEYITPNGYVSCEGQYCQDSYDRYVEDTGDNTSLDELF